VFGHVFGHNDERARGKLFVATVLRAGTSVPVL
jgi:hypothetical protein